MVKVLYWLNNFKWNWTTIMGAEEFYGYSRNCEWMKFFCCAGEFYWSIHNFQGCEKFSGHAQNCLSLEGVCSKQNLWADWKFFYCFERKLFFQMKGFGVPEDYICFTEDVDAALSNIFVVKDFIWELINASSELKNFFATWIVFDELMNSCWTL